MNTTRRFVSLMLTLVLSLTLLGGIMFTAAAEGPTVRVMMPDNPGQALKLDSLMVQAVKEKTGITIELEAVPASDYDDKKGVLIGSNNLPDIIYVFQSDIINYAHTGVFLPLLGYIQEKVPNFQKIMEEIPDIKMAYIDDNLYAFPQMFRHINRMGQVPMMRLDVLEKLGLSEPTTFDELYTTLKKIKEAYPDCIPLTNRRKSEWLIQTLAYPLGSGKARYKPVYFDKDVDNGKWIYGAATAEFKEVLVYLNKLYAEGLLDPDFATNTDQQWKEKMASGRAMMYYDNPTFSTGFNISLKEIDPDARLGPIHIPQNSKGIARTFYYPKNLIDDIPAFAVAANSKNIDAVMELFNFLYSEEGCNATNYGIEGQTYTVVNGEPELLPEVVEKYKAASTDGWRAMMSDFGAGELSFCPYIDERTQLYYNDEATNQWYRQFESDPGMVEPQFDPPFTGEESKRIKELLSVLDEIVDPEIDKFIMGTRPLEEYDDVIQQLKNAGSDQLEKIYNDAYARIMGL